MPIKARLDMLSTGIRTPVGLKINGADLETIQKVAVDAERILQGVAGTRSAFAERTAQGYFLDFVLKREALARYGLSVEQANMLVMTAIGGDNQSTVFDGRARYPVNVRYARDYRESPDALRRVLIPAPGGALIPMEAIADLKWVTGPAMIRDENGQMNGYVLVDFDTAKIDVGTYVQHAKAAVEKELKLPAGYSLTWSRPVREHDPREGAAEGHPARHAGADLRPALRQHQVGLQGLRGDAGRALQRHRRLLAALGPGLQHEHRRVGGSHRPHGARCGDRRLHAALPGPQPRRGPAGRDA